MGKTYNHTRNAATIAEHKRRQDRRRVMSAVMLGYVQFSVDQDFDDLTLSDLAGLDHATRAGREG